MAAGHVRKRSKRVCYKQFENWKVAGNVKTSKTRIEVHGPHGLQELHLLDLEF